MNESEAVAAEDPPTESSWSKYHEQPVMLQLREPYIGVNYAHQPSFKNPKDPSEGIRATPVLSGVLFVTKSGTPSKILLILRQVIDGDDSAFIAMDPADVLYCTHIDRQEPSRIITAD